MTRWDLARMPRGDRGPALRQAAQRQLAALDLLEAAPRLPGRDATVARTRRVAIRLAALRRLAAVARHHGIALPPAVAARATPRKGPKMTSTSFPSLNEDLTDAPLHDEIRKVLMAMIVRGEQPVEVIEAALATSTALCVDSEGLAKTAVRLLACGQILGNASPEIQAKVATEQHKAGATSH